MDPIAEWKNEPNELAGEYKNYVFFVKRNDVMGFLCGYVILPAWHMYYQQDDYFDLELDVHGGVTYADTADNLGEFPEVLWTIGFDCGHYLDLIPFMYNRYVQGPGEWRGQRETYKNMDFVIGQCQHLIDQLIERQDEHNKKLGEHKHV
jgi:hypothetical protein